MNKIHSQHIFLFCASMPRICIPIKTNSISTLLEKMEQVAPHAEVVEIWFGELFHSSSINFDEAQKMLEDIFEQQKNLNNIPLLFTIKDEKEQGNFGGTHDEKKQLAQMLWKANVDYLDLDYEFDLELFETFKQTKMKTKTQLILSAHFFEGTPSFPSLKNRIQLMQNRGADIVKIAAQPNDIRDVVDILRLAENLKRQNIKFIAISMGQMGKITRVMTPLWGGEMMFAPLEKDNSSASGQVSTQELQSLWNTFKF